MLKKSPLNIDATEECLQHSSITKHNFLIGRKPCLQIFITPIFFIKSRTFSTRKSTLDRPRIRLRSDINSTSMRPSVITTVDFAKQ